MYKDIVEYIRELYQSQEFIPLHVPTFNGNEKKYVDDCIETTFVSSVGKYVNLFEDKIAQYTGSKYAVAVVNGTAALQIALQIVGVQSNDEVITQPLTFVATANAIKHANAIPVFIDVDKDSLGLSPEKLNDFLVKNTVQKNNKCINKISGNVISACVPMHTFGHACRIDEIVSICEKYNITVVEDSAESIGSYYKDKHTGTFGEVGILSFNGNKTITCGGGGMIITDNEQFAQMAKHLTTTAKVPHAWEYVHDFIGYNYRLTNVNAAIGVAQMEQIDSFIKNKRETANSYANFFSNNKIDFITEPLNSFSNYWLNAILFKNRGERDEFLKYSNENKIMTRPVWELMNNLSMYKDCLTGDLSNSEWLKDRIVNIPSSVRNL